MDFIEDKNLLRYLGVQAKNLHNVNNSQAES